MMGEGLEPVALQELPLQELRELDPGGTISRP